MKSVKGAKAQKSSGSCSSSSSLSDVDLKNKQTKDDERKDPEVKFHSIGIISNNVEVFTISLPLNESEDDYLLFTLREGVHYQLKLTFTVLHNDVHGLVCINRSWKDGLIEAERMEPIIGPLGAFAPQEEAYIEILEEEFASPNSYDRGIYSQWLKFEDAEKRCHLDLHFIFEIKKKS